MNNGIISLVCVVLLLTIPACKQKTKRSHKQIQASIEKLAQVKAHTN